MTRIPNEWRYFDDKLGIPYPWYTKPCLEFLEELDLKGKMIYEYGLGDSTEWYLRKGAVVDGVDSDDRWVGVCPTALFTRNKEVYSSSVIMQNRDLQKVLFDIIIIDGDCRDECTEYALQALKPGGLLIIDNYRQKSADLEHWPLTEKLIEGMNVQYFKEPEHQDWLTIIVTK